MQTQYTPPVRSAGKIPLVGVGEAPSGLQNGLRRAQPGDTLEPRSEPIFSPETDDEAIWRALLYASNPSGYQRLGENLSDPGLVPLGVPQLDTGQSGSSARARPADWTVEEGWGLNDLVSQRRRPIVTIPNPFYRNGYWRPFGQPVAQIRYPVIVPGRVQEHLAALRVQQLHGIVYEQPSHTILNDNLQAVSSAMNPLNNVMPLVTDAY